jgi:CheY-like chemotaxis protein
VKRQILAAALTRLEEQVRLRPDFEAYLHLGIGYANLQQWRQAENFLQAAQRQRPADPVLRRQISALLRKRESVEIAAKVESSKKIRVQPPTILVVDTSPALRDSMASTLTGQGYRVVQAGEGHAAVELMRREGAPDLIFAAVDLPGLSGYQLSRLVRQHAETRHIPVVLLANKEGFLEKIRGHLSGSNFFLTTPFTPEELIKVAASFLPK